MVTHRINAYRGRLQLLGVHSVVFSDNPSASDWAYPKPTIWINEASDASFLLVDNTENAAVWTELTTSTSSFAQGNDALSIYDITTAPPASPSTGDAYIMSATGTIEAGWVTIGATYKDYVIYDGSAWKVFTPQVGSMVYVQSLKKIHVYVSSEWKTLEELVPFDFQDSVKSIANCTLAPPTEVTGDRYILDQTAGTVHADWDGAAKGDLVEFDGVTWQSTTPTEGMMCSVEDIDTVYIYVTSWGPLVTNVGLTINSDGSTTAEPNASGNMSIVGDTTSGINVVGDNANTVTVSADAATTTQAGTLETATDAEAQGKTLGTHALTPLNLAALGASSTFAGLVELATDAEAQGKSITTHALTPGNLAALGASDTFAGLIEIATNVEAQAVTATDKAVVPSNLPTVFAAPPAIGGTTPASAMFTTLGGNFTQYGAIYGGGTASNLSATAAATDGQVLIGASLAAPAFATLTSSEGSISYTAGANSLSLNVTGASETQIGGAEVATDAEVTAGTDNQRIIPPQKLKTHLASPNPIGSVSPNTGAFTTISASSTSLSPASITSTDGTGSAGPILSLVRDSSSPAANDFIGEIRFRGKNSLGTELSYGVINQQILDATSGSEDSAFRLLHMAGGSLNQNVRIQSGGITFNGGTDVMSNYEVGTFTPTVTGTTGAPSITYTVQRGDYIRIGDCYWFTIYLDWSAFSGGSGTLAVEGLPFVHANLLNMYTGTCSFDDLTFPSSTTAIAVKAERNSSKILFIAYRDGLVGTSVSVTGCTSNTNIFVSGWSLI